MRGHNEHRQSAQYQEIHIPPNPLLQLFIGHRIIARLECLPEMAGCQRAERQPKRRRLRKFAVQFLAKQQIVKRNQHDPVWQADDTDEKNPCERTGEQVFHHAGRFRLGLAKRTRDQSGDHRDECGQSVEPVIEHCQRSGPAEAVDANNGN